MISLSISREKGKPPGHKGKREKIGIRLASYAGVEPYRVCLTCWHFNRRVFLDNEAHVFWQCEHLKAAQEQLLQALSPDTLEAISEAQNDSQRLLALLGSQIQADWQAIGLFCYRLRQRRRKMAAALAQVQSTRNRRGFATMKAAWRGRGNKVCRHGGP